MLHCERIISTILMKYVFYLDTSMAVTAAGEQLSSRPNAVCIVNWDLITSLLFHTAT